MSPLRIAGLVMISAALMFGGVDLFRDVTNSGSDVTVVRLWTMISYRSLSWVQSVIQGYLWAPIWDKAIAPILLLPAWMFFSITGALAFFLGRRKIE